MKYLTKDDEAAQPSAATTKQATLYSLIKSISPGTTVIILADQKLISHYAAKLKIKCTTQAVLVIEGYKDSPMTARATKVTVI